MANPVLNGRKFEQEAEFVEAMTFGGGEAMTVNGTVQIAGVIGLIVLAASVFAWTRFTLGYMDMVKMLVYGGAIVGFILAIIISLCRFSSRLTNIKYLIPFYAVCEGFVIGGISAVAESYYPGIVSTAIAGTFAAFFSMLILYQARVITCTDKLRSIIFISTLSIAGVYLINFIGMFFGLSVPFLYSASPLGIAISVVIVIIAAFNLLLDFDFVEKAAMRNFPKEYEWYGAFGLMVTLIWLYLEILNLLIKIQKARR